MKLLYEGKAKQLFECEDPNEIYVHYKNSATAFNGVKKEEFEGKGELNNAITALIFEHLQASGIKTHFIKKINATDQLCQHVEIIPLEVIIRNRVAGSMAKRYGIEEGKQLAFPVFELSYKNDDLNDPLLNDDHAVALEIISCGDLQQLKEAALKINEYLQAMFLKAGLVLVDFKLEFGRDRAGEILLADEISPDTCRLWDVETMDKLDKDRFRRDMGSVVDAYVEVHRRLTDALD